MKKLLLFVFCTLMFVLFANAQTIEKVDGYYYLVSPNAQYYAGAQEGNNLIKPTGEFLDLFTKDVQPKAISDNGEWACGAALVDKSFTNAVKWNLTTGVTIYLQESETDPSDAYWISNDGSLIGGSYLNAPAYNLNGEWITLDMPWVHLNGGEMYGEVVAITINDGDTTCLGWVYTQTDAVLARWINGEVDEDFSDYESTNQYLTKTRINDKQSTYHQLKDMSTDGSRLLISLDWIYLPSAGLPFYITTYVQTEDTTLIIERNFDDRYEETSFVDNAVMSPNGKWVCGDFYVFPKLDSELSQGYVAFLFDVDNDSLIVFDYIKSTNKLSTATAVDDNGNVYFKSNNMNNSLGKPYIYKENEYVELESCLLAYEGINAGQIDAIITDEAAGTDEDDLGLVCCISADGKTLIGAGGALRSNIWAAKLSCSPYDLTDEQINNSGDTSNDGDDDITEEEVYGLYVASENPEMGGVKIILVAEAIEGFEFVEWSDGNTSNPRIIELTEDTELYARFKMVGDITNVETSKILVAEVYSRDGVLYVEGAESDYYVLDAAGRLIYSGRESALNLPRGVYLVTIAGEVEKVVI